VKDRPGLNPLKVFKGNPSHTSRKANSRLFVFFAGSLFDFAMKALQLAPVTYLLMERRLSEFVYLASISVTSFLAGGFSTLALAVAAVLIILEIIFFGNCLRRFLRF
jgi:hypothetical protein